MQIRIVRRSVEGHAPIKRPQNVRLECGNAGRRTKKLRKEVRHSFIAAQLRRDKGADDERLSKNAVANHLAMQSAKVVFEDDPGDHLLLVGKVQGGGELVQKHPNIKRSGSAPRIRLNELRDVVSSTQAHRFEDLELW